MEPAPGNKTEKKKLTSCPKQRVRNVDSQISVNLQIDKKYKQQDE